ncbi:unnamed protein product [Dibothriocephalus latus]|uniref:Transcription initiation factor TFIID subunit 13 n=1 Tax=Dibothriocephalus latus TaxID=60516 RepID=A0A3P7LTX6_DIBLA|nr:unnamed protein product [Dibothriocephalus latus]
MADGDFNPSELFGDLEEQETNSGDQEKRLFLKDIRSMLYAFGDVESPLPETVAVLEEIAVQYIIDMQLGLNVEPVAPGSNSNYSSQT